MQQTGIDPPSKPMIDKEIKVKIACRLHVQLHSRKILQGKPIQQMVTEALDAYFRDHQTPMLTLD